MTQQVSIIQAHILIYEMIYDLSINHWDPCCCICSPHFDSSSGSHPGRNSKVSWSGPQKKTAMNIIPGLPLRQLQCDWGCCIFFCGLFHCRPQNLDGHKDLDAGVDNLSPQVKGFTSTPNWTVAGTWQHGKQCSLDVDIEKQIFDSKPKSRLCFHFNPITESDRRKLSIIKQWKEWKWSKSQAVAWIFAESSGRALIFKRILAKHRANENEY